MQTKTTFTAKELFVEKSVSLIFAAAASFLLSSKQIIDLYIVMGLGHIFLSHLYQYRVRKLRPFLVLLYVIVGTILFLSYSIFHDYRLLVTTTSCYVAFHVLIDEKHLFGEKPSILSALDIIPPFMLYTHAMVTKMYFLKIPSLWTVLFAFSLIALRIILSYWLRRPLTIKDGGFMIASVILGAILLSGVNIPPEYLFGSIGLYHYAVWYIRYLIRTQKVLTWRKVYLMDVAWVNIILIAFFLAYRVNPDFVWLKFFYKVDYFFIWAFLHIVFTIRKTDIRYLRLLPA